MEGTAGQRASTIIPRPSHLSPLTKEQLALCLLYMMLRFREVGCLAQRHTAKKCESLVQRDVTTQGREGFTSKHQALGLTWGDTSRSYKAKKLVSG